MIPSLAVLLFLALGDGDKVRTSKTFWLQSRAPICKMSQKRGGEGIRGKWGIGGKFRCEREQIATKLE